jgi:hypothetical protein
VDTLRPSEKEPAEAIMHQVGQVAKRLGENRDPVLSRLKSNNPNASYLVAYVPADDGRVTAFFVHSSLTGETHSLVDLPNLFAVDVHEIPYVPNERTTGFTYRFYDRDKYVVEVGDTETRLIGGRALAHKKVRFNQRMETGYSYGGLSLSCPPNSSVARWFVTPGPSQ